MAQKRIECKKINGKETLLDSGLSITLGKYEEDFINARNLERKVIMSTNSGEKGIKKEGNWSN